MRGSGVETTGIDPDRVAEVIVTPSDPGPERRGSGYRVSPTSVLTAAHVVDGAARVRVRFNADRPGEWVADTTVAWADPGLDAAVLELPPPAGGGAVEPVGFGRVGERDAVIPASAMGFPRFKLRQDQGGPSVYRDSAHAVGTVAVLANRRQGTLEVMVDPPERDPDPARSPWEGMSGAALWSGGRVVGLVAEHHRSDGLGRLAATRVDAWYERLGAERLDRLRDLLALPARRYELADVVPAPASELLQASYLAQVRDLAPERLLEREAELEELVQFCAGEERYRWLHGPPWAGKSALAAWFVLHPPAGVTVVSFFVTRRLAGQTDSTPSPRPWSSSWPSWPASRRPGRRPRPGGTRHAATCSTRPPGGSPSAASGCCWSSTGSTRTRAPGRAAACPASPRCCRHAHRRPCGCW